jgi:hypothetical protein
MFDINPAAHHHYLSDLERTFVRYRNHEAQFENRRLWKTRRRSTKALSVMIALVAAYSSAALF